MLKYNSNFKTRRQRIAELCHGRIVQPDIFSRLIIKINKKNILTDILFLVPMISALLLIVARVCADNVAVLPSAYLSAHDIDSSTPDLLRCPVHTTSVGASLYMYCTSCNI